MRHDILDQIPSTILQSVKMHLRGIDDFNDQVRCMRQLEQRVGQPGRYEWDVRLARQAQVEASVAWLDRFAAQAATLGITAQEVYDALGLSPTPLPWAAAAREWRR